jgi:diamine N-acetyltransferase
MSQPTPAVSSPAVSPTVTLVGESIALGPLSHTYLPEYHRWLNDIEVMATYSLRWTPKTWEATEQWYAELVRSSATVAFTLFQRATLRPIGFTALVNINHYHQIADFDIIIGEKSLWGQGYGTEATRLTAEYGFVALNLHSIMLTVRSFNAGGIRAYERAGFRLFGRRREARQMAGQRTDLLYMECLATEFQGHQLRDQLARIVTLPIEASSTSSGQ